MKQPAFSTTDLARLQSQLSAWRRRHPGRPRLPEALWAAATELAAARGPSVVARTLRLDYAKLRQRLARPPSVPLAPATFVEVKAAALSGVGLGESGVELSDGTGAWMTFRVPGDLATLVALAQSFWRRRR